MTFCISPATALLDFVNLFGLECIRYLTAQVQHSVQWGSNVTTALSVHLYAWIKNGSQFEQNYLLTSNAPNNRYQAKEY